MAFSIFPTGYRLRRACSKVSMALPEKIFVGLEKFPSALANRTIPSSSRSGRVQHNRLIRNGAGGRGFHARGKKQDQEQAKARKYKHFHHINVMPTGLLRCKRFLRWPKGGKTMERQSDHRMSFGKQVEPYLESSRPRRSSSRSLLCFLEGRPFDDERQPRS